MAAKNEIDFWVIPQDLPQRQPEELAIIAIEEGVSAPGYDSAAVYSESELIRVKFEVVPKGNFAAVRYLDDVVKAQPAQIIHHAPRRHFRHDDLRLWIEQFLQRGPVKMIPVKVSQVDELRRKIPQQIGVGLRKIPPAAPVT